MNNRKPDLSVAERRYLENEEFNKQNVEEVVKRKNLAAAHRKEHGYSLTFAKLMKKHNCATADEWRELRKKHKKAGGFVGEPKPKKEVVETTTVKPYNKNKNRR